MEKNDYYSIDYFSRKTKENEKSVSQEFEHELKLIRLLFDTQSRIANNNIGSIRLSEQLSGGYPYQKITITAFFKNLFALYSALDLTNRGLYGSARKLLRYSFEFMMIAKYCSISKEINLIKKWEGGEEIWLSKEVLKKISNPDTEEFNRFWKTLCKFIHATIFSQQINLDWNENKEQISLNYNFIRILLECNYHLLNSHLITPKIKYYLDLYENEKTVEEISSDKRKMRKLLTENKKYLTRDSRKLIYCYKRKWEVH